MTTAVVDSTVLIHLLRGNQLALTWIKSQAQKMSVTPITWMEIMYGVRGKSGQAHTKALLDDFDLLYLTQPDQEWAMQQMFTNRLSHGVVSNDCLIASVCQRLQVPLYTHNVKDFQLLLGSSLVFKPY